MTVYKMQGLKEYEFYYTLVHNKDIKYIVETKLCKAPERTKIYKSLNLDFNQSIINSFGYQLKKSKVIEYGYIQLKE